MEKKQRKERKLIDARPIAARLRRIRNHYGYRQDEMAESLGISKGAYGKNERGEHLLDTNSLARVHERLGICVDWLLFDHGPMFWKAEEKKREIKRDIQEETEFSSEIEEMIDLMKRFPFLRHAVMGYYQKFKLENKNLLLHAGGPV